MFWKTSRSGASEPGWSVPLLFFQQRLFEALGISLIFVWDVYISEENWIIVQRGF